MIGIAQIDWGERKLLASSSWAVIYEIRPGVVAKVGGVDAEEARLQRALAARGLALPVLDYNDAFDVPIAVWREVHELLADLTSPWTNTAPSDVPTRPVAVLLMPRADPLVPDHLQDDAFMEWIDANRASYEEAEALMKTVCDVCYREFGHEWDVRLPNVARYEGRLIALDFGHMLGPWNENRDELERAISRLGGPDQAASCTSRRRDPSAIIVGSTDES